MQLNFKVHDGKGPYLLLVHGFLMSAAQWSPNLRALSEVCRPVVVELWGHGDSAAPDDPAAYLPNSYIQAFDAIRDSLGAEHWWLCGYSLGAGLTIGYALAHPQRVIGHVFTNSTSAFADTDQIDAWRSGAADAAATIEAGGIAAIERMPIHPRHAKRLAPPLYDALCRDAARLDPRGIANTLRYTNPNVSVRTRVHGNTRPALLICGSTEQRFAAHRAFAAQQMPHLSIVDLPVGHGVNMEDPDGFNRALTAFIRTHSQPK
jgi:pimeloyl-ACP methyl ester carboxylesterase